MITIVKQSLRKSLLKFYYQSWTKQTPNWNFLKDSLQNFFPYGQTIAFAERNFSKLYIKSLALNLPYTYSNFVAASFNIRIFAGGMIPMCLIAL